MSLRHNKAFYALLQIKLKRISLSLQSQYFIFEFREGVNLEKNGPFHDTSTRKVLENLSPHTVKSREVSIYVFRRGPFPYQQFSEKKI